MTRSIRGGGEYPGRPAVAAVSRPKRRRRRPALVGILGVVVALVAGLAVWPMRSSGPLPNLAPFEAAIAALDTAHAVHYRSSAAGSAMEWDVRVTRRGDAVGTATVAGQQLDVLAVEGRTFVKLPANLLPRMSSSTPGEALKDKWITGSKVTSGGLLDPLVRHLRSPGELSRDLRAALDDATAVPRADDSGTVIDGVSALAVDTPAGRLFVTQDAPHRVLRLARTGAGARSSLSFLPSLPAVLTVPALPAQQGPSSLSHGAAVRLAGAARPPALPGPENTDFPAMTPADVDDTYRKLQAGARELTEAVDIDLQFSLNGTASVHCSAAGCSISVDITVSSTGGGENLLGWIDVTLNGSFTIEGRPAGDCTSVARLRLGSGGTISCRSKEAGVVFARVDSQKRAQAQRQANVEARARPNVRASVSYQIASLGEAYVTAKVQVDVPSVVQRLADERADARIRTHEARAGSLAAGPSRLPSGVPSWVAKVLPPKIRPEDVSVQQSKITTGKLNGELNNPKLNTAYWVDGRYLYVTDNRGRVAFVEGTLYSPPNGAVRSGWRQGRANKTEHIDEHGRREVLRKYDKDQGGHLIGAQFGGPAESINYVPQSQRQNNAVPKEKYKPGKDSIRNWYESENNLAEYVNNGETVRIRITPRFLGGSTRPNELRVDATLVGTPQGDIHNTLIFYNY